MTLNELATSPNLLAARDDLVQVATKTASQLDITAAQLSVEQAKHFSTAADLYTAKAAHQSAVAKLVAEQAAHAETKAQLADALARLSTIAGIA